MKKEIRRLKIASVLHRAISKVLIERRISSRDLVVSEVKLSKDLKEADIYIVLSSLNEKVCDTRTSIDEINQSAWLVRKSILRYVNLRFVPKLVFKTDLAFDNFVNLNRILSYHI